MNSIRFLLQIFTFYFSNIIFYRCRLDGKVALITGADSAMGIELVKTYWRKIKLKPLNRRYEIITPTFTCNDSELYRPLQHICNICCNHKTYKNFLHCKNQCELLVGCRDQVEGWLTSRLTLSIFKLPSTSCLGFFTRVSTRMPFCSKFGSFR